MNMARIISLKKDTTKKNYSRGQSVSDYNFEGGSFSIWTYKNGDINRSGDCSQNLQFDKEHARVLRDALNDFLGDT